MKRAVLQLPRCSTCSRFLVAVPRGAGFACIDSSHGGIVPPVVDQPTLAGMVPAGSLPFETKEVAG